MSDRPSNIPLLIALVLAIAVHLLMARPLRGWMVGAPDGKPLKLTIDKSKTDTRKELDELARQQQKRDEQKIGQLDPSTASVMHLVSWEDAEKLLAPKSSVDQPAIQQQTEPDPVVQRTPVDPTPPSEVSPKPAQPAAAAPGKPTPPSPAPPAPPQPQTQTQPSPQVAITETPKQKPTESQKPEIVPGQQRPQSLGIEQLPGEHPTLPSVGPTSPSLTTEPGLIDKPLDKPDAQSDKTERVPKPVPPSPQPVVAVAQPVEPQQQPAEQPTPQVAPRPAVVQAPSHQGDPTVATKSDFESPPVSEIDSAEIHPGAVLSIQGVQIRTSRPRYSVVARMTSVPRNPTFRVHFSAKGVVDSVEKLAGSGYDNVDGPIVTALWTWRAEGKIAPEGLTLKHLHILLGAVQDDESSDNSDTDD